VSVPVPTTPSDILTLVLKQANVVGVGQVASAEDMNDCFNLLNMMLAQLQRRRYFVYQLVTTGYVATGAQSYTVGPGGNFNIPRPSKIESAFFRQQFGNPQPVDYPLEILRSTEDYNRISLKSLNAFPRYAFYDMAYPIGNLFIWPLPSNQYEIFITTMLQLQQFNTINDTIALPAEYKLALLDIMVPRVCRFYGLPVDPSDIARANGSLNVIKEANAAIPQLQMPPALKNNRGSTYNIYGDFFIGSSP